ncbi:phage tail protein I [Acinetobacter ursingii]|uniref:phage tail protein I n=1 Tax=Acinetobacter ursingii TaxID=108980 RepID=UPI00124F6533|nr:phage tail protein I [Acinetobacter ursingii]
MSNLLPPNSTQLERNVCEATAQATNLDVNIKTIATLKNTPKDFLPLIAWQNSVDRWNRDWSEKQKIAQIKASFQIHQKKGTVAALKEITKAFGYSLTVTEWWQEEPTNTPGTFQITIDTEANELTESGYNTLVSLLNDAKPLTRELKGIELNVVSVRGDTNVACAMYDGEDVTIYPKQNESIPFIYPIFAHYGHDETTVYPRA